MKKFVLSTLACLIANQAFAATNTVSDTTTAKTAPATKAVTKKTTTTKTATTKAASTPTAAATTKKTTTDSKTAKKSQNKTATTTAKKPQPAKPATSVTQSTTTPKVASATAVSAATDIPLTPIPATTLKLQALLDWNHASPGPIDGGWGMNAKKALKNFQAMHGLPQDGRMNAEVWKLLNEKIPANQPVLVGYTLTQEDIKGPYQPTPSGSEAKSKMKGLYYQDVQEMLAERFHMDIRYLKKLNSDKKFTVGETITVFNPGAPLNEKITRLVAKKADNILYAYNGDKLIATYPTTVGSSDTPSPTGTFSIVNRVKNPWYRASSGEGKDKKVFMLPPGPNGPVGVVWMGLSKPSYGIHGSPVPEGISRQASHGCVRLTNWDVLEVYANVDTGTKVDLQ